MGPLAAVRSVVGFPMRLVARVLTGGLGRAPEDPERWLIVGLGNPGSRFERTRHNVGFDVLDRFAAEEGLAFGAASGGASDATAKLEKLEKLQRRSRAKLALGAVAGKRVVLVKPQTFMNLSGESVKTLMRHYRVSNDRLLVVYDDLDTPVARLKLKGKGGHGGHNGVRNIIDECPGCSDKSFPRLKVGVGRPKGDAPVYDHVLTRFDERDRAVLETKTFVDACDAIRGVLTVGLDRAMTAANDASGGGARPRALSVAEVRGHDDGVLAHVLAVARHVRQHRLLAARPRLRLAHRGARPREQGRLPAPARQLLAARPQPEVWRLRVRVRAHGEPDAQVRPQAVRAQPQQVEARRPRPPDRAEEQRARQHPWRARQRSRRARPSARARSLKVLA